jgi:hypothetical protein
MQVANYEHTGETVPQVPVIDPGLDFYVSCRDESSGRACLVLGPYAQHADAIADVRRGRKLSREHTSSDKRGGAWVDFYSFGTCSLPVGTPARVVFTPEVLATLGIN